MPETKSKAPVEAMLFAGFSALGGGLHYLFQLEAAKTMSALEFGEFSVWAGGVSAWMFLGALAQFVAVFFPMQKKMLLTVSGILVSLAVPLGLFAHTHPDKTMFLGVLAVLFSITTSWLVGQAQIRNIFILLGLVNFLLGLGKFLALPFAPESHRFYFAFLGGYPIALVALFLGHYFTTRKPALRPKTLQQGLSTAIILSALTMIIPQLDILFIGYTQTPEITGQFARVSLFYRAIFFSVMILAQWYLPKQIAQKNKTGTKPFLYLGVAGLTVSIAAFIIGPYFASHFLRIELADYRIWILLSCINITALTMFYLRAQESLAHNEFLPGASSLGLLCCFIGVLYKIGPGVEKYLISSILFNLLLFFWVGHIRKSLRLT